LAHLLVEMRPFLLILLVAGASAYQEKKDELSPCLSECIQPLAKMERSFAFIFNNFEKVCENLERGAHCVMKCGGEDAQRFHQLTAFYRLYCVDYEEELEPHVSCLARASQGSDKECKRRCAMKVEKQHEKEKKMKHACSSIECSTVCYYQLLSEECPNAQDVLLNLNLRQISEMASTLDPKVHGELGDECRHIHDTEYMRRKLLDRR
ncbi:hypothetical protein PMAYCL1PPCAC_28356, partial [Pristionchus mayeri]